MSGRFIVAVCVLALRAELVAICALLSGSAVVEFTQIEIEEICERDAEQLNSPSGRNRQKRSRTIPSKVAQVFLQADSPPTLGHPLPQSAGHRLTPSVLAPLRC